MSHHSLTLPFTPHVPSYSVHLTYSVPFALYVPSVPSSRRYERSEERRGEGTRGIRKVNRVQGGEMSEETWKGSGIMWIL